MDFFTVLTLTGRVLFVLIVLSHARRRIVHFKVTEHPTAQWTGSSRRYAADTVLANDTCPERSSRS